jgi:putative ABC transport system permease protein
VPGITAVSLAMAAPGFVSPNAGDGMRMVENPGNPEAAIGVRIVPADSHFVDMLGMKILHGRNLIEDDPGGALVNQSFAREFFGREDVVGESMPVPVSEAAARYVRDLPTRIVGVVGDVPFANPLAGAGPMIHSSARSTAGGFLLLESTLPLSAIQEQIREIAKQFDLVFVGNTLPLARARYDMLAPDRARGLLIISAATIVLLLAGFGFYGTQRYLVLAGRREYAIRSAVGATPAALGRLVLQRGLRLAIPGALLALPLGVIMVAWLRDYYIPRSISPYAVALFAVAGLLGLALMASIGPAGVARRTQPAQLLRES